MAKPWERRKEESSPAYGAFLEYLKVSPERRNIDVAYRSLNNLEDYDRRRKNNMKEPSSNGKGKKKHH